VFALVIGVLVEKSRLALQDIAKIADLVLLMINGRVGFEMETFEFLNVLQVHGFPKVMGILTHLDQIPKAKPLKKIKKTLKARFWVEVYQGAKMFYFSGRACVDCGRGTVRCSGCEVPLACFRIN
jgi:hypothetical protein